MLRSILLLCVCFSAAITFAQVPTISGFTPMSAAPGNPVVITGTNFSTTPSNNIVIVGAVRAVVTAANATSLTVIVPTGATNEKISVTVGGLTCYSRLPFTPTFAGGGTINTNSFTAQISLVPVAGWGIQVGDLNLDGKPDLMASYISLNANGATAVVCQNLSLPALIDFKSSEFGAEILKPGRICDFDGDGKLDLILISQAKQTLQAFRNQFQANGTISGPTSYFPVIGGKGMEDVACGDIDGDGKPDLAVCNRTDKTLSVLRNTSADGNISFSTPVTFPATDPLRVAVADVNADGKPDVIVANFNGSISVFGNTASVGVINASSLAAKVDFGVSGFVSSLALSDIDADGKTDVMVTNGSNICILKNISAGGAITGSSFATKVDVPMGFFVDQIQAADLDGDTKPDLVVTNGGRNSISILKNITTVGVILPWSFNSRVDFPTTDQIRSICIADADGDTRPDIIMGGSSLSYFQNIIGISPPTITSFNPASGGAGNLITINGSNFSTTAAANVVKFNGVKASVLSSTASTIVVSVPETAATGTVTVSVIGRTANSPSPFTVIPVPKISSFIPTMGGPGTSVTITGINFSSTPPDDLVKINGVTATVTSASPTSLVVSVPPSATTGYISVTVNEQTGTSAKGFIVPPITTSTLPTTYNEGGKLTASITLNDASKVSEVVFASKGMSQSVVTAKQVLAPNGNVYTADAPSTDASDPLGVYYYFRIVSPSRDTVFSDVITANKRYPKTSPVATVPNLSFGTSVKNYQIISVPFVLTDKKVTSAFSAFGGYDKKYWRLFSYENEQLREYPGFTNLEPGKGYWFIAREKAAINLGEATTVPLNQRREFKVTLQTGWNLIGNPFNFPISWDDVVEYNGSPNTLSQLTSFENGYLAIGSQVIAPYRGGFVINFGGPLDVYISANRNKSLSGRVADKSSTKSEIDSDTWELKLELSDGQFSNATSGIGMNPQASDDEIDVFDFITLPSMPGVPRLELRMQPEHASTTISKQVVKTVPNYQWRFDLVQSQVGTNVVLSWNNQPLAKSSNQLFMIVPGSDRVVDMKTSNSITLDGKVKELLFVYGEDEFIRQAMETELPMLSTPYPNPADREITIPFRVSSTAINKHIAIRIFNNLGECISTPVDKEFENGLYEINWSGSPGLYVVKMEMGSIVSTKKIVIK